ncbi:MAG: TRAP transporter small permease [Acetobacteraceae bacterium]|nr:TRAP transporter small permease [Acetobacteraceae bacterium]MDW8399268.1 TRAP transporter small permease [Acetobacteraceae bacterium]
MAAGLLALLLIAEVLLTSFFATSQPWVIEYAIFLQAAVLFAGSGWALRQGAHIRVSVLLAALPARPRRLLDMAATALALGILAFAAWALLQQWLRSLDLGSRSFYPMQTPLWIPQGVLTLGVWFLVLALAARLIRLARNEPAEAPGAPGAGGGE